MRTTRALALSLLLATLAVPNAAADFPWDEARDVYYAGGVAVEAGGASAVGYSSAAGAAINETYAAAAATARGAVPDVGTHACALGSAPACSVGMSADAIVDRYVDNALAAGDEARRIATVFATSSAQQGARFASEAYRSLGGAFPP